MIQKFHTVFFWLGVFAVSFLVMVRPAFAVVVPTVEYRMAGQGCPFQGTAWTTDKNSVLAAWANAVNGVTMTPATYPACSMPAGSTYSFVVLGYSVSGLTVTTLYDETEVNNGVVFPVYHLSDVRTAESRKICPSGYNLSADQLSCETGVCPAAGTLHSNGFFNIGTSPTGKLLNTACSNACKINLVSGVAPAASNVINGVKYYFGNAKYEHTGLSCSPDTPTFLANFVGNLASSSCASGQQMISMGGVTKCFNSTGLEVSTTAADALAATKAANDAAAAQAASDAAAAAQAALLAVKPTATAAELAVAASNAAIQAAGNSAAVQKSDPQAAFCSSNPTSPLCTSTAASAAGGLPSNTNGSWYTKTYPNGIQGVLTTNFNVMKSTPLFGLISDIVPTISGAAASGCFTFTIWKVGNQQLCIPQGVLTFVGICMMLTALFSARSIIFGG